MLAIMDGLGGGCLLVLPKRDDEPGQLLWVQRIEQVELQHLGEFLEWRDPGSDHGSAGGSGLEDRKTVGFVQCGGDHKCSPAIQRQNILVGNLAQVMDVVHGLIRNEIEYSRRTGVFCSSENERNFQSVLGLDLF